MSKIIASAAIKGAHKIANLADQNLNQAIQKFGNNQKIEFPNTAYYLPIIYSMLGIKVEKLSDMVTILDKVRNLLPEVPSPTLHVPYLGHVLDAGMATLFAEEIIEALKYLENPIPYTMTISPTSENIWLGAADDKIMRERGIEFVDGSAPGFAACVGACPDNKTAVKLARELQEKNLYIFLAGNNNGKSMSEQLKEEGVQLGWETRLIPFSKDIYGAIFALGFASRAALAFGGVEPGDFKRNLIYNKHRIFAFVLALGEVSDEWYATAAGAINYGFPVISYTDIPQILPTGVCLYEHVVSNIPFDNMVEKALEVRGLKIVKTHVDIPVAYASAFEGERIRKEDTYIEFNYTRTKELTFEFVTSKKIEEIEDGKIEVLGKDLDELSEMSKNSLGIVVEVAGARMQSDFEPILERQIHSFLNEAQGVFHMGQRNINWIRISKTAKDKGFLLSHIGTILLARIMGEYSSIVDKAQVKIITDKNIIEKYYKTAMDTYHHRDDRLKGLTDEAVDTFYTCTLCQSFAPDHICIVTPERSGLCGAYNWLDGKAAYEINPHGPNQPIPKGDIADPILGQWKGVNDAVYKGSHQKLERMNAYSIMEDPMTSCGCFECISAILPMANGIMIVDRDHLEMTPCGMKFSTLAGSIGGGQQVPGFVGHSKYYIGSKKFMLAEGGIFRVVWMPKKLKDDMKDILIARGKEDGIENLYEMIADETVATDEEAVMTYLEKTGHPALTMDPLM
ncbi:MAG: acetyl-CoA decarbonylase/synthase complex subunit alpha/beta [bacterium]|nr:acetyl-CoA decarbonylase/synthase complex subunit alpha/beta [bacterium]